MLLITAASILARRRLYRFARAHGELAPRRQALWTVAFGALLGVLVSLTSVGAGAIGISVLMLLYPRLELERTVATDIAHAVPLTLVAGVGHWLIGDVHAPILLALLAGSIPGIVLASVLSPRFPERIAGFVLAAVLGIVGTRMLIG
jgi:uncharacterized membrane protein YfcA